MCMCGVCAFSVWYGLRIPFNIISGYVYSHIKTVTRLTCVDHFVNEHCPTYRSDSDCPYGSRPIDPQGHYINCGPWTPWVDNHYPVAQLNHYWTLSLQDFLRKIHRGKGGSYAKGDGNEYRGSREFFGHARQKLPFVDDESFLKYYGSFFTHLKTVCPACFDTSLYYLTE
ncbi:hypothetical protein EON65_08465 [archaeon]|nr:MAG: hypothetical protein EON65_08465 [archaeon]